MFNQIWSNLQLLRMDLIAAWDRVPVDYKAGGCLVVSLLLMWQATQSQYRENRSFFIPGALALAILAYGAILFVNSR
jgi:hypothetical protein